MERNYQKNGLVNLAVALLIFLAGFGVTVFAGSLAGQTAAVFLGLGVLISMFTAITVSRTFLFAIAPKTQSRFKKFLFSNGFHF